MMNLTHFQSFTLDAIDGPAGKVRDLYYDDEAWVVRYLLVETSDQKSRRQVLIPSIVLGSPDDATKRFPVSITRQQVQDSPDIDTDKPVSRQYHAGRLGCYDYPAYWSGLSLDGSLLLASAPSSVPIRFTTPTVGSDEMRTRVAREDALACVGERSHDDPHLRSANAIAQYHLHAIDGNIGHVQGLLVDEKTWAIRYLLIGVGLGWIGHQTLLAPEWIEEIDWIEAKVVVNLSRDAIKSAPAYNAATMPNREFEVKLCKHYDRDEYWSQGTKREGVQLAS